MLVPSIIKFAMISFFFNPYQYMYQYVDSLATSQSSSTYTSSDTILFPEKFSFTDANPSLTDYTSFPKSKMDTLALIRSDVI